MTLRFGNGMHKVGATRGRPPGSGGFGREKARAAADKQQRRIHTFFTVVASGGALVQGGINVPRGDGTVDPDSPTTDAEEGDDDAAEDSEE